MKATPELSRSEILRGAAVMATAIGFWATFLGARSSEVVPSPVPTASTSLQSLEPFRHNMYMSVGCDMTYDSQSRQAIAAPDYAYTNLLVGKPKTPSFELDDHMTNTFFVSDNVGAVDDPIDITDVSFETDGNKADIFSSSPFLEVVHGKIIRPQENVRHTFANGETLYGSTGIANYMVGYLAGIYTVNISCNYAQTIGYVNQEDN